MKEYQDLIKVISGANEEDCEKAIELYIHVMQAILASLLVNKKLVAKFIVANRNIIMSVVNFIQTTVVGVINLIPQFSILEKNMEAMANEWDTKSMRKEEDKLDDGVRDLCKQVGDRLDIDYQVLVKVEWDQEGKSVMWIGEIPKSLLNAKYGARMAYIEDKIRNNNFEFTNLEITPATSKDLNKKYKAIVTIDEKDYKTSLSGKLITLFLEGGLGKSDVIYEDCIEFLKKLDPSFDCTTYSEVYVNLM